MTFLVVVLIWFALSAVLALACGAMLRTGRGDRHAEAGGPLDVPLPPAQRFGEQRFDEPGTDEPAPDDLPSDEEPSDEWRAPPMAA